MTVKELIEKLQEMPQDVREIQELLCEILNSIGKGYDEFLEKEIGYEE